MANYITSFSSITAYNEATDLDYPNMSLIESDSSMIYQMTSPVPPPHDYSLDYFTVVSEADDNTISIVNGSGAPNITVSASTDDGSTWSTYSSGNIATLNRGDKLLLKGVNNAFGASVSTASTNTISSTSAFHVEGNIMSLLYGDSFTDQTSLADRDYAFYKLFKGTSNLTNAENLVLPATTLSNACYKNMFNGCIRLTTAPALPATTLSLECYNNMFMGCSDLTTTQTVLPATTLMERCYGGMFFGCSKLTTAPALPAKTLTKYCYDNMFNGCSSLNYIKCLATNISASKCLQDWVNGVAASGTFAKDASMTSWGRGNSGIPRNWTVVDNTE